MEGVIKMNELLIKKMQNCKMSITELAYILGVREATVYGWVRPYIEKRRPIKKPYLLALCKIFRCNDFIKQI